MRLGTGTGTAISSAAVTISGTVDENLKQVNGAAVNVGTGAAGTGTQRVSVSSDSSILLGSNTGVDIGKLTANQSVNLTQWGGTTLGTPTNFGTTPTAVVAGSVNASIFAGTTALTQTASALDINLKTIAAALTLATVTTVSTVSNVAQINGVGPTFNSTATSGKQAIDTNILSILGTAPTTAGFVDIKGADGNVFVRNATSSNLLANVTLQTQTDTVMVGGMNIKEINAATPLMGSGIMGTGSLRVTIASDNDALTVKQGTASNLKVAATLDAETTKVIGTVRSLGNVGAVFDGVNTAATAPANGILGLGIYNSTEPSPTTGQSVGLQQDSKGRLRQVIMDAAGNTRGVNVTSANELLVSINNATLAVTESGTWSVRTQDGAGNALTTNSTTYSSKFALDSNLLGTLGTAFSTAGKVDVKSADGDVFVRSNAASTFPTQATLQTQTDTIMVGGVNIKEINAATPLMGNGITGTGSIRATLASDSTGIANYGHGATAATAPTGATYEGTRGTTALPTAVSDGQLVGAMADKFGRQVVVGGAIRDLRGSQTTTISASTSETTIITAGAAGIFNDLVMVVVSNTSASATRVDFRDATAGTIIFSLYSPAGQPAGFSLPGQSIPQTSSANNWTAQSSASVTDLRIFCVYEKNK